MRHIPNPERFYRDATDEKIAGVCAGIAKHFDLNPWLVRGATAIAFVAMPVVVALGYLLAVMLIKYK